jgi:2-methylcitrate dehydratase PrpD
VSVQGDAELSRVFPGRFSEPAVTVVRTQDGRQLMARSDYASGDPEKPLTAAEIEDKFLRLAGTVLSLERARDIARCVDRLEQLPDVSALTRLMSD